MHMPFRTQSPVWISNSKRLKKAISQIFQKINSRTFFNRTADHISIKIAVQPFCSRFFYHFRILEEISDPVRSCVTLRPVTEKQRAFQTCSHCQHIFQRYIPQISFRILRCILWKNIHNLLIKSNQPFIKCDSCRTGHNTLAGRPGVKACLDRHSFIFCR